MHVRIAFMSLKKIVEEFGKIEKKMGWGEKVFCTFAMAFIIAINIFGIASRYLFNKPILYIQELTILGGVWLFFIGIGLVYKGHSDITVELLVKYFSHRLRMICDLFVDLLILLFVVVVFWQAARFIPFIRGQGESHSLSFALELPDEIYYYPIGLGALFIFLTVFPEFVGRLIEFRLKWKQNPPRDDKGRE